MERKGALSSLGLGAALWLLSLLLSADVAECQDDLGYYSPNENYTCLTTCSFTFGPDGELVEGEDLLCRCDSDCTVYGDCCDSYLPSTDSTSTDVPGRLDADLLECRSIYLDEQTQPGWGESFWMVSACPVDWLDGGDDQLHLDILDSCLRGSEDLPPVTDLETGLVYKNEYCAVCNQVYSFIRWGYTLECSPELSRLASQPNFTVTLDIIEQWCLVCRFRDPHVTNGAVPAARACVHRSLVYDKCFEWEFLQEITDAPITGQLYHELVTQCTRGSYEPVEVPEVFPFIIFHNQYCALCRGIRVSIETLVCVNHTYRSDVNYCQEKALKISASVAPPITEPPTTEPTNPPPTEETLPTVGPNDLTFFGSGGNITEENNTDIENYTILDLVGDEPIFVPFTVFVDPNRNTQTFTVGTTTIVITTTCGEGEVFDYIINKCRKSACREVVQGETCVITGLNGDIKTTNGSLNNSFPCDIKALVRLNISEFTPLDNETLEYRGSVFEIVGYINDSPVICTNFTQTGTIEVNMTVISYSYPVGLTVLTYVGCFLSVVGCVIVLLTYTLFKELRTLPGKILMNLCAAILATSLFLLVGIPLIAQAKKEELCQMTAIFLHWLALSQFSWMTIMSYELARTMVRASKLRNTEANKVKRNIFLVYLLIGWGLPTFVTLLSVIVNYTSDYIQYGEEGFCWIGDSATFYVAFLTPVILSLLLNGAAFFVTSYLLVKAQRGEAKLQKQNTTSYFRIHLSVFSITGLTWVFGFVAILARDDWAWYIFIILTSTQGFAICVAFLFTQKVLSRYKKHFRSMVSSIISLKSTLVQSTQDTLLAMQYVNKGGNATTESTTSAKETEIGQVNQASGALGQANQDQVIIVKRQDEERENDTEPAKVVLEIEYRAR